MFRTPPTPKHLSRMYFELSQAGAACSGQKFPWPYRLKTLEEKILLAAEWTRWDPRLLGILVEFFLKHWDKIISQNLRRNYQHMTTPQTLAVVAEFCKTASPDKELHYYMDYLQRGLAKVPTQYYFKGIYAPGGKLGRAATETSLKEYKKWGFLARERPTMDVYSKKTVGRLDQASRLNYLSELFAKKKEIALGDYLKVLKGNISRQQALADLRKIARLKRGTQGRGARWVKKI